MSLGGELTVKVICEKLKHTATKHTVLQNFLTATMIFDGVILEGVPSAIKPVESK